MVVRPAVLAIIILAARITAAQSASPSQSGKGDSLAETVQKSFSATEKVRTPYGDFAVWIDTNKWRPATSPRPEWLEFRHATNTSVAVARVITDGRRIPTIALLTTAISNLKGIDPKTKVTLQQKRTSNGHNIIAVRGDGSMNSVPTTFVSYIYGGTSGNIQSITIIPTAAFVQAADVLQEFLDGLDISDQEIGNTAGPDPTPDPTSPPCYSVDSAIQPTPYNFAQATLRSLWIALIGETGYRVSVQQATGSLTGGKPPDKEPATLIRASTDEFVCGKRQLRTFLFRPTPQELWDAAYGLTFFYDARIALNGRMLGVVSKAKTWPAVGSQSLTAEGVKTLKGKLELAGEVTTVDGDEVHEFELLPPSMRIATGLLLDPNDRERLVVKKTEKQALLDRIAELFPDSVRSTAKVGGEDGRALLIQVVDVYLEVLNSRKGADE
jgi:hypothetical protein